MSLVHQILDALAAAGSMTWQIAWSLVLGFTLSAVIQAVVRRETISRMLGDDRPATLVKATGLGVAASSCSYAAVALARSLFRKGSSFTAAMVFGNVPLAGVLWDGGISFGGVVSFLFADLIILPILLIYRTYYGTRMMLTLLAIFYATMVTAGYVIELLFGGLGLVPGTRDAKVMAEGISWNYTTWLNIVFLLIAVVLVVRFLRTGGRSMMSMMNGSPDAPPHDEPAPAEAS